MRHLITKLRSFLHDRQGVAAIEFVLITPALVLLYFGTVDLANWYMAHRRLVVAGSTIADITTQMPGQLKKSDLAYLWNKDGVGRIVQPLPFDNVTMTMFDYRKSGSSLQQQWTYSASAGACGGAPPAAQLQTLANSGLDEGKDVLVAQVCATVQPIVLQVFGWKEFNLKYQITMFARLGKLDCTGC